MLHLVLKDGTSLLVTRGKSVQLKHLAERLQTRLQFPEPVCYEHPKPGP